LQLIHHPVLPASVVNASLKKDETQQWPGGVITLGSWMMF
jgi:hypothetical protein